MQHIKILKGDIVFCVYFDISTLILHFMESNLVQYIVLIINKSTLCMHFDDSMKKDSIRILILLVIIALSGGFVISKLNNLGQVAQVVTSNAQVQIPLVVSGDPVKVPTSLFGMHLGSYYSKIRYNMDNPAQYNPSTGYAFDQEEIKALDELNLRVYRFPSGTDSRYYHFFTSDTNTTPARGYGYRIADVNNDIAVHGHHEVPNVYGSPQQYIAYEQTLPAGRNFIYDLIDDAKRDNARVMLVANVVYGIPQEVVAQIALLKQNGVGIAGVEMGNETNADDIGFDGDPALYLAKARTFAMAIKAQYPDVKVGLVSAPHRIPGSDAFIKNDAWNTAISNALVSESSLYNAYIFHSYPQVKCDSKPTREQVFECANEYTGYMKNSPTAQAVKDSTGKNIGFPTISESLVYFKNKFPGKKMWITEWNLSHWTGPAYQGSGYYSNSMFNALFTGIYRNELNRFAVENPNVIEFAIQHNVTGFMAYGLYNERLSTETPSISMPNSLYVKRALYHEAIISKPIYNRSLARVNVSAQTNEDVDVYGYVDQVSNNLFIYFVNRSGKTVSFPEITYGGVAVNMTSNTARYHQMSANTLLGAVGKGGAGEHVYDTVDQISVTQGNIPSPALFVASPYSYGYISVSLSSPTEANIAPSVSIVTPSPDATYSTSVPVINFEGAATDVNTNDSVTVSWEFTDGTGVKTSGTSILTSGAWQQGPFTLKSGNNVFKVIATDSKGLSSEDLITVSYASVSDLQKPTVKITGPTGNNLVLKYADPVTITATATDNVGVKQVDFYTGTIKLCTDTTAPYSCDTTVPAGVGTNQMNSFRAFSKDYQNNTSSPSTISFTVTQ